MSRAVAATLPLHRLQQRDCVDRDVVVVLQRERHGFAHEGDGGEVNDDVNEGLRPCSRLFRLRLQA
jgi:hypothetical protein